MSTHFVLIDFASVQPTDIDALRGRPCKVKVFLGTDQVRIPLETARAVQSLGADAEYIRIEGSGADAAVVQIAFHIGRLAAEHGGLQFHVVSRATGLDPLIGHLRTRGIVCTRSETIDAITGAMSVSLPFEEKLARIIDSLVKRGAARPATLQALGSTIDALFADRLADAQRERLLDALARRGVIQVKGDSVSYELPLFDDPPT